MSTRQQDDVRSILDVHTPLSLQDQLLIERASGYKALGSGPLEPEPKKRMPYEDYLQLKRMQFP